MGLFGAIVRTAVNVASLPVKLPIAAARDAMDYMENNPPDNTKRVIEQLKEEADEDFDD